MRKLQRRYLIPLVVAFAAVTSARATTTPALPNTPEAIGHALNRLAFGARSTDADTVKRLGLATWIDQQLHPERIDNAALQARLERLTTIGVSSGTIAKEFVAPARQERRRRQQDSSGDGNGMAGAVATMRQPPNETMRRARLVLSDLTEAKILRAVYSERQLEEVLVDFWFNHFNVFARKGQTEIYISEFEREAIRPHVLGKFRDLLDRDRQESGDALLS